ncbi:ABC transporter permease [Phytohabitans houttuyneae]|uniref:Transport permease protein n=1 Tax=Phytohabitans houttuyneae TaxID=1076126 RepID=A0A6V8KP46_9ACTN|nr:ABC transporter permease [Phytohabitans houttuyneae]GFJ84141.1 transport permease protein [Phytohabitans houttuyneae]
MTTMSYALTDTAVMFRRGLLHMRRYPVLTFMTVFLPVVFLLLFVYVFGGTLGDGLGGAASGSFAGGREAYANYVVPGILLMTVAGTAQGTAITVAMDMTEGIVDRFRTMAIFRPSVLSGHVLGSMVQSLLSLVVVAVLAVATGFRPNATPVEWLAAAGVLMMITFAVVWLSVALGLVTKSVESASNLPMPLLLLPFLGSGFVPTDSMPAALRWFAEYQPFTPVIETLRGLLLGTGIGHSAWLATGWSVAVTAVCFQWAKWLYNRER